MAKKGGSEQRRERHQAQSGPAGKRAEWIVDRVQTGVRIEKRILKVLKALAEYLDMSLGDLLEGVVLHAFDGKAPFSRPTLQTIARFKEIYNLDLDSSASHRLTERGSGGT